GAKTCAGTSGSVARLANCQPGRGTLPDGRRPPWQVAGRTRGHRFPAFGAPLRRVGAAGLPDRRIVCLNCRLHYPKRRRADCFAPLRRSRRPWRAARAPWRAATLEHVEASYALAPVQHGVLFHLLGGAAHTGVYVAQAIGALPEEIDDEALVSAFEC